MRLFENLDKLLPVLVFVAIALFNWWSSRQATRQEEEEQEQARRHPGQARPMEAARERQQAEAAEAERAKQLQEEIRRRIAERRHPGEGPAAPARPVAPVAPPPLPRPVYREQAPVPEVQPAFPGSPASFEDTARTEARAEAKYAAENLVRMAQERQRIEAEAARLRAIAKSFPATESARRQALARQAETRTAAPLLAGLDLSDPEAARRAIVLAEVLGSPVGQRERQFVWET